jgi:hypothetical protein
MPLSRIKVNSVSPTGNVITNLLTNEGNQIAFRNKIINGAMAIDQRNSGASVTAGSAYTLDRWNVDRVWTGSTVTIQQSAANSAPGFANSILATVSTGAAVAAGSYFSIQQYVEAHNISDLSFGTANAQQFTVSFWVRSSVTGAFGLGFRNSAFDLSYWTTYNINAANTWEKKSVTIAAPTTGTWYTGNAYGINIIFSLGCGSTYKAVSNDAWNAGGKLGAVGEVDLIATTGATFNITGVQLEEGAVATPFEHRSYGTEFSLCQRYYQRISGGGNARHFIAGNGSNTCFPTAYLKQTMRAAPSYSYSSLSHFVIEGLGGGQGTPTFLGINAACADTVTIQAVVASGITGPGAHVFGSNASAWSDFSSEL